MRASTGARRYGFSIHPIVAHPGAPALSRARPLAPRPRAAPCGHRATTEKLAALDVAVLQLLQKSRDGLDQPDQESQDAEKVVASVGLRAGLKQVHAHGATVLRLLAQCVSPLGLTGRHAAALEAARVDQLVGDAIGARLLELRDGMPVTRWRVWLREESPLPRPLVERYVHAAEVRRERRVEQSVLAQIPLDSG